MSQQINLYSPIFLSKKKYFSAVTLLQGLGLIVISMAGFYAYAMYQVSALVTQAADVDKRLTIERARLTKVTAEFSPRQRNSVLEEEVKLAEAQLASKQRVAQLFKSGGVGATKGFSEFMRALARQSVNGLWLTGFDISGSGSSIAISGRTVVPGLVPTYLQRLSGEPATKGYQLASLQMRQPSAETILAETKKNQGNPPAFLEFDLTTLPTLSVLPTVATKADEKSVSGPRPASAQPGEKKP